MVWRVDRRVWRCCDELTVLFDLAFVTFKSFAVVGDFDIARLPQLRRPWHCFWVLPDRRADKKNNDWWLCYVLACDELTVWRVGW